MQLSYVSLYLSIYFVVGQEQEYEKEGNQQLPPGVTRNVVMSMMPVYLGLGVLSFASSGEVLREIREALKLEDDEATDKAFFGIQDLFREAQKAGFLVSSCLFVHAQFGPPRSDLVMIAQELFSANIKRLDFDDEEKAMRKINKWAKKTSGGVISGLVYPALLRPVPNVFLANVVHFKGRWKYGFEKIEPQPFSISRDYVVTKDMMYIQQTLRYGDSSSLDAEIIQLPLYNQKTVLHIMLPRQTSGITDLEERVYDLSMDGTLDDELRLSVERPARVWIPKFSFESRNDMKKLFRLVGVRKVFSATSGGMERLVVQPMDRAGPPLSVAVQAARIDVTGHASVINKDLHLIIKEEDTSAVNFRADRPFFFVVTVDEIIVLLGKYTGVNDLPLASSLPSDNLVNALRSRPKNRNINVVSNKKILDNITYCKMPPAIPVMDLILELQEKKTKPEAYEDGVEIINRNMDIEVGSIR